MQILLRRVSVSNRGVTDRRSRTTKRSYCCANDWQVAPNSITAANNRSEVVTHVHLTLFTTILCRVRLADWKRKKKTRIKLRTRRWTRDLSWNLCPTRGKLLLQHLRCRCHFLHTGTILGYLARFKVLLVECVILRVASLGPTSWCSAFFCRCDDVIST